MSGIFFTAMFIIPTTFFQLFIEYTFKAGRWQLLVITITSVNFGTRAFDHMNEQRIPDPDITIATAKDIPALDLLVNSAYRGEGSKKGWTTEADLLDGLRTDAEALQKLLEDQDAVILKYSGKTGLLHACVYLKKKKEQLYLGMLSVSPELQASGIGKKLLNAAEIYAVENGCSSITMTVISVRHELIAWYERHGYRPTGETEPFPVSVKYSTPRQPLVFIVMEKKI